MLEKERFLAIKKLAEDIRKENEKLFDAFKSESTEDAIREKDEFVESVINSINIKFSEGEQGREEKQIFRANILIPDDDEFFKTYTEDKNIRNLMNKYAVSIEDIMSKITELNIYGQYLNNDDFVDEFVNLSKENADSLLDEIEELSQSVNDITENKMEPELVDDDIIEDSKEDSSEEDVTEDEESDVDLTVTKEPTEDDFDNITNAVSNFVDEYSHIQEVLDKSKEDLEEAKSINKKMQEELNNLKNENEMLKKNNLESASTLKDLRSKNNLLENENTDLKEQIESVNKKLNQSSELLRRIYNSIPKKN